MSEALAQFIDSLKSNRKISEYSEDQVKQGVILPVLQLLGWNPFDIDEVTPEYSVKNGRVDYALRVKRANRFFIEAKKPSEELEKHQDQLLEYSYREGVDLAALTNGLTWWFYLPTEKGSWQDRKFYTVDIQEQDKTDIAEKLMAILLKERVENGQALKYSEEIYKGRRKKKQIEETIPEAWNRIISEPDTLLVDLLCETTGKLCGYTPDNSTVTEFLKSHHEGLLMTGPDSVGIGGRGRARKRGKAGSLVSPRGPYHPTGRRDLGRRGHGQIEDYIVPVISMIRKGVSHHEAFRKQAEVLDVRYQTVNAQCTRVLGLDTQAFVAKVRDGTIVTLLKKRYPHEVGLIEQELG